MININVNIDLNNDTISIGNLESIASTDNNLTVNVNSIVDGSNSRVHFNGFKYGFFIRDIDDKVIQFGTYPNAGDILVSSNEMLVSVPLEIEASTEYRIQVYVEDAGNFYDITEQFSTPKHEVPADNLGTFDSWVWNDVSKLWEAPEESPQNPEDGSGFYKWEESSVSWTLVSTTEVTEE